jgi:hypothetical protein
MGQQNPKEAAARYSRQYLEIAERAEKRDPAESILTEIRRIDAQQRQANGNKVRHAAARGRSLADCVG